MRLYLTLFEDYGDADRLVARLHEWRFDVSDVSVALKDDETSTQRHPRLTHALRTALGGLISGAFFGGFIGLMAGLGVLPGLTDVLVNDPIATTLGFMGVAATVVAGLWMGALIGAAIGALSSMALSRSEVDEYREQLERGGALLAIPVQEDREEELRELLNQEGVPASAIRVKPHWKGAMTVAEAGRKGGRKVSRNRRHMAMIGRKGGLTAR